MARRLGPRQIYSDHRLHPHFCVDLNANTCIALTSKQCKCVAFNLNASFELDARSICYLASISKILALTSNQVVMLISTQNSESGFSESGFRESGFSESGFRELGFKLHQNRHATIDMQELNERMRVKRLFRLPLNSSDRSSEIILHNIYHYV